VNFTCGNCLKCRPITDEELRKRAMRMRPMTESINEVNTLTNSQLLSLLDGCCRERE